MSTPLRTAVSLLSAALLFAASDAAAQTCEVSSPLEGQRLLRRLSIDLRGYVPTFEEQALQSGHAEVSPATVDVYLESLGFVDVMREYHANMLWPNYSAAEVDPLLHRLFPVELAPGDVVFYSVLRALYVRSITQPFVPCANKPAQFDANGQLVLEPLVVNGQTVAMQEGWVMVEPYWAPGTQIKVCALDAQTAPTAPACTPETMQFPYMKQLCDGISPIGAMLGVTLEGAPTSCSTQWSMLATGCGCGPNLNRCNTTQTAALIRQSLVEQQMRMVDRIVAEDRPYTDLLLEKEIDVNGYLAHYLRHQSQLSFDLFGEADASSPVPADLDWTDGDTWTQVTRTGRHSGVLTTPGYLLKFQSNRARAFRFYNAFECSSFIPTGALPSPNEACSKNLDLTKRCGCDTCHTTLEPMSANWGRFAEYGFTPLDESRYPKNYGAVCTNFKDIDQIFRCFRFYLYEAKDPQEATFLGLLRPYTFRTADDVTAIETGPSHLAQQSIMSGRFAGCTVRKLWTYFMRRAPTAEEELSVIPELQQAFEEDGHRVRGLVRRIVTHPAYGRMP